ncbi:MAG: prepilin-type N-terminal cleavage/methylation domain-containing protein [Lachnospiraceae bacterium]|nr:prepilin-type N-terminal cleavage/methylation domain-containing protein [Lachnospiraceae bacterium]
MNKTQLNNKGFSLIEMLISLAIAGFVVVSAITVVTYAMRMYGNGSKETKIQSEVQFTGNLVGDLIKTGNSTKSYIVVNKDTVGNVIEVYVFPSAGLDALGNIDTSTGVTKQYLYYNVSKKSLYVYEGNETVDTSDEDDMSLHLVSRFIENFSAEYVQTKKDVTVNNDIYPTDDMKDMYASDSNVIKVDIDYKVNERSKSTSITYKIRNK